MNKKNLKVLLALSHHYGSDPEYILAGGGNTSYKTVKHLYIKASGVELARIDGGGFVCLNRDLLAGTWDKEYSEDPTRRWVPLNHTIAVNRVLGYSNRVAMTNRPEHSPNEESNAQIYAFFEHFLQTK